MNPIKQRIAIAEIVGWRINPHVSTELKYDAIMCWIRPGNMDWHDEQLPDYLNNLNATYDAIQQIIVRGPTIQEFRSNEYLFQEQLDLICDREQVPVWHFTAELYCEALLKTLGKWENE